MPYLLLLLPHLSSPHTLPTFIRAWNSILTVQRMNARFTKQQLEIVLNNPNMKHHVLDQLGGAFLLESFFGMYRRMMIGAIIDPYAQVIAIVLTALEEAALRSTMVFRDTFFARIRDGREMTGPELELQRMVWAASSASSMFIELVSIITCRVMYVAFHQHRFVINLGYTSGAMGSVATMVVAAFGEIVFEIIVDAFALDVESRHGIDLGDFWSMWRMNPGESCVFSIYSIYTFDLLALLMLLIFLFLTVPLFSPIMQPLVP